MKQMTQAAVERAMKLQDVMLPGMAKRITCIRQWSGDQLPADAAMEDTV